MMEIMCECDWDLGVPLPAHSHLHLTQIELGDGRGVFWVSIFLPSNNYDAIMEVDELRFGVDWKELWRQECQA